MPTRLTDVVGMYYHVLEFRCCNPGAVKTFREKHALKAKYLSTLKNEPTFISFLHPKNLSRFADQFVAGRIEPSEVRRIVGHHNDWNPRLSARSLNVRD